MARVSRGQYGRLLSITMVLALMLSLSGFVAGSPVASTANGIDYSVTRNVSDYEITIGDVVTYTTTYVIPAGAYVPAPILYDEFNDRGQYVIAGTSSLESIGGTPTVGASFATTSEPVRSNITSGTLWTFDYGTSWTWNLEDIDNSLSLDPYYFTLTYDVVYTGVLPNGSQIKWPALANAKVASASSMKFAGMMEPVDIEAAAIMTTFTSNIVKVDVDQPLLDVEKTVWPWDIDYAPGQPLDFDIVVTNVGWSDAHDITVDDTLPEDFAWDSADFLATANGVAVDPTVSVESSTSIVTFDFGDTALAPGTSIVISMFDVVSSEPAVGIFSNVADADWSTLAGDVDAERVYDDQDWEDADPNPAKLWTEDTSSVAIPVSDEPYIKITKSFVGGLPPFRVGDEVVIDITLRNIGTSVAPEVGLVELFDSSRLEFLSASVTPSSVTTNAIAATDIAPAKGLLGEITWEDITGDDGMHVGDAWSVRLTYKAIAPGWGDTIAWASSGLLEPNSISTQSYFSDTRDLEVQIYDPADITFVKASDPTTDTILLPGDVVTYGIIAENNTGMDLEDPACIEELPDSVDYVPGSMVVWVNGWDVELTDEDDGDGGTYDAETHTITFLGTGLYTFAAEDEVIMTFDVEVGELERSYHGVLNRAELVFNEQTAKYSNEVYHFVDPIEITKTGVDVNGGRLVPGDEIEWTITVVNVGLSQTTNVVISDTVPANTTYVADSIVGAGADDSAAPDLTWTIGVLPVDGTASVSFRTTVDEDLPAGTQISNQASASSDNSAVVLSDDASTAALGDPTLLRTGGDEIVLIAIGTLVLLLGTALIVKGRKAMQLGTAA